MRRSILLGTLALVVWVLPATADSGKSFRCEAGDKQGREFWLFVADPAASCRWTSDTSFECAGGADRAAGDCWLGCALYEGSASCVERADDEAGTVPQLDVACGSTTYRLSDPNGTCRRSDAGGATAGALCTRAGRGGEVATVELSCELGCQPGSDDASCKCLTGCAGQR